MAGKRLGVKPASCVLRLRAVSVLSGARVTAHGHGAEALPDKRVAFLHQMRPSIDIPDSYVCRKKGGWVFYWMNNIQKKPQGMEISLRQKGALNLDTSHICDHLCRVIEQDRRAVKHVIRAMRRFKFFYAA